MPTRTDLALSRRFLLRQRGTDIRADTISPNWLLDVLDLLLAKELKAQVELSLDAVVDRAGDGDVARLCQALKTCGHVDPVTVDRAVGLLHDVAQVSADAK